MRVVGRVGHERRKDRRVTVRPITLKFEGESHVTTDWGFGGFAIEDYDGRLRAGDTVPVAIVVDTGDREIEAATAAEIVRINYRDGTLAASFVGLDGNAVSLLDSWLTGRIGRRRRSAG